MRMQGMLAPASVATSAREVTANNVRNVLRAQDSGLRAQGNASPRCLGDGATR